MARLRFVVVLLAGLCALAATSTSSSSIKSGCKPLQISKFVTMSSFRSSNGKYIYILRALVLTDDYTAVYAGVKGAVSGNGGKHYLKPVMDFIDFSVISDTPQGGMTETLTVAPWDCDNSTNRYAKTKLWDVDQPRSVIHASDIDCPKIIFIDSRGSGVKKPIISPPGQAFSSSLQERVLVKTFFGWKPLMMANPYPAAGGLEHMVEAGLKVPGSAYNRSVGEGKKWLKNELLDIQTNCSESLVYLTGYSQGAQVTGDVYQSLLPANVLGVVLFGDPKANHLDQSVVNYGQSERDGVLGPRAAFNSDKVISFCHIDDPFCSSSVASAVRTRLKMHGNYADLGEPELAASRMFNSAPLTEG